MDKNNFAAEEKTAEGVSTTKTMPLEDDQNKEAGSSSEASQPLLESVVAPEDVAAKRQTDIHMNPATQRCNDAQEKTADAISTTITTPMNDGPSKEAGSSSEVHQKLLESLSASGGVAAKQQKDKKPVVVEEDDDCEDQGGDHSYGGDSYDFYYSDSDYYDYYYDSDYYDYYTDSE